MATQRPPRPGSPRPARSAPAAKAEAPTEDAASMRSLGAVVIRNEFYRDGYRTMLRVALLLVLVIVFQIGVMFYVVKTNRMEYRYFATTEDGRLIPMAPLSEPNLSSPALMSWVAQAATEVMTFGFNDYRRRLQEASRNFTRRGWESFSSALQRSRIIETVEANQQVVTAAPTGAPVIQSEGMVKGRYQWVVQVPMSLSYQAGSKTRTDDVLVTLVIVRVPRLESPNGVGIEQWIASAR
ncbi:MAG: type IVB secretion system apparatus protein IcmL/DotI [Micavibrio aeruginosavorus]|uniref:Type IVB secretion system apparatus protein IcmL/DotI n=1 Tax=Micavibrio aeruginosavorus TaxID=349221 RepID=A0A7T5R2N9_9BACT|nr:MAG: type IVB secretion system apparatus protein IcmL/DotI [Micavibrio aeruginosavorus]